MKPSFILLAFVLIISCQKINKIEQELSKAEFLINNDKYYDALEILDSIKQIGNLSNQEEALTNLLWIKAKDKLDSIPHSDSIINKVMDYYIEGNHSPERHAMVFYYAGRVSAELKQRGKALEFFNKALDCLRKYEDPYFESFIHSQIVEILSTSYLFDLSIRHLKRQYECEVKTGQIGESLYTKVCLAYEYRRLHKPDTAKLLYDEVSKNYTSLSLENQEIFISQIMDFYMEQGYYDKADSIFSASKFMNQPMSPTLLSVLNRLEKIRGEINNVKNRSLILLKEDDIYIRQAAAENLAQIYTGEKNIEKALFYTKLFRDITAEINKFEATEAIAELETIYDYSESQKENESLKVENQKKKNHILWLSVSVVVLLLIIATSLLAFKLWRTKIELKHEEALREADRVIQEKSDESVRLKKELEDFKASIAKMEEAKTDETPQQQDDERAKLMQTANRMEQLIELSSLSQELITKATSRNEKITDEDFIRLEKLISDLYPKLISYLRSLNLSQRNFRDSLQTIINTPVKICAIIFNVSPQAICTARNRLYHKYAADSGFKDWVEYLQSFCKEE